MTDEQRTALREQYDFRCGYCSISETDAGSELTVDHFQPTSKGGGGKSVSVTYTEGCR